MRKDVFGGCLCKIENGKEIPIVFKINKNWYKAKYELITFKSKNRKLDALQCKIFKRTEIPKNILHLIEKYPKRFTKTKKGFKAIPYKIRLN